MNLDQPRKSRRVACFLCAFLGMLIGGAAAVVVSSSMAKPANSIAPLVAKAGILPAAAKVDKDLTEELDAAARKAASEIMVAIARRDSDSVAASCDTPFFYGEGQPAVRVNNRNELAALLQKSLYGGAYGPYMFSEDFDVSTCLGPAEFFEAYHDYLQGDSHLSQFFGLLDLQPTDRFVVEQQRGMALVMRSIQGQTRAIAMMPIGFRPRPFQLTRDLIYGRKYGTALTLDLVQPLKESNRGAVLCLQSDTFVSNPPLIGAALTLRSQRLLDAGYTLLLVTHSGAPRYSLPEIIGDIHRAVRFARFHADRLGIDEDRIAIMGGSSGGYLALMIGSSGGAGPGFPPNSDPTRMQTPNDPIENVSSRVAAVVSYCPPTDWSNYGGTAKSVLEFGKWQKYAGVLDLYEFDETRNGFDKITDVRRISKQLAELSPTRLASSSMAPTLLFHGDKDSNVPLQQSELMLQALKRAGVDADIVVKHGEGHGWSDNTEDTQTIIAWLDKHL